MFRVAGYMKTVQHDRTFAPVYVQNTQKSNRNRLQCLPCQPSHTPLPAPAPQALYPLMNVDDVYGCLYSPKDGTIDPSGTRRSAAANGFFFFTVIKLVIFFFVGEGMEGVVERA
jgi:glycine/D-amino acid oxidase-like deaminating enzyme